MEQNVDMTENDAGKFGIQRSQVMMNFGDIESHPSFGPNGLGGEMQVSGGRTRKVQVAERLQEGENAIDVLDSLQEWGAAEFWAAVEFLAAHRRLEEALQVFDWWKLQANYTAREKHYTTFIRMLGRIRRPEVALELFDEMKTLGIQPSVVTHSALLQSFVDSGLFDRAERILKEMVNNGIQPNAVTYTGLIHAYGKQARYDDMTRVFKKMKRWGCSADFHTYSCLIEAYSRGGLLKRMESTWREMDFNGWKPDSATISTIIEGYAEYGDVKQMHNSYMLLKDYRILVSKNTIRSMALAYIRNCKFPELRLFARDVGLDRGDVDNLLWHSLLLSQAANFQMRNFQRDFEAMKKAGFKPDVTTFNICVLAFSRMKMFWDLHVTVLHMLSEGVSPDLVTFGAVVDAYIDGRLPFRKMFEALDELQMKGLTPDVRTDLMVFEVFGKGDFQRSSEILMQDIPRPYGWTYGTLTSFYLKKSTTKEGSPLNFNYMHMHKERLSVHKNRYTRMNRLPS